VSERSTHPEATTQLRLLPGDAGTPDWVLDERTRLLGRQGIAQAREVLRRTRPPEPKAVPRLGDRKAS
jgi:hypothetical protein